MSEYLLCGYRLGGWWGAEGEGLDDVETSAAKELMDDGFGEAGGVVLYADGFGGFVELELSNAVDLA